MVEPRPTSVQRDTSRSHRARRRVPKTAPTCKTCRKCRAKKVKCDGDRPSCGSCLSSSQTCTYPEDARKSGRLTKAEVEALQSEVFRFRQLLKEHGGERTLEESPLHAGLEGGDVIATPYEENPQAESFGPLRNNLDLRTPPRSAYDETSQRDVENQTPRQNSFSEPFSRKNSTLHRSASLMNDRSVGIGTNRIVVAESPNDIEAASNGPSPFETQVACAIAEDGSLQVHGITSHLHQPSSTRKPAFGEVTSIDEDETDSQIAKDQLFANAALQRQRETTIFGGVDRNFGLKIDLDGLPTDLAIHLLDLHWNRQHFAYLLTYRPAIIDSLTNNGPYANKLLLNAIYYSSCLYSDRSVFRADLNDPQSMGDNFYKRFKMLLMDEIDRPSLPTVVALLLCGTTLVSNGKQSGGWVLCGMAYRMVTDLGCHLGLSAHRKIAKSSLTSLEIEIRTRIYWGAFLTDKFQSLYLGRSPALRPSEARVSKVLRDYYEELENWTPYVDPVATSRNTHLADYRPRPAYAISTFQSLIPLGEIAYLIASTFYSIDSIKLPGYHLLKVKMEIQDALDDWIRNLPAHLHFDPDVDPTPPPNQITPHATYHTLTILLERPFLSNGHLSSSSDSISQAAGETKCVNAAVRIWRLVDAYKSAFTLRRTAYLLSYAIHSAIVVLLNQQQALGNQYVECIRFFWFALLDLQRGCNSGLRKPLKILKSLMQRLGQSIPDWDLAENFPFPSENLAPIQSQNNANNGGGDNYNTGRATDVAPSSMRYEDVPVLGQLLQQTLELENWDNINWMDTMMNDQGLMDDSLFGLFTPGQATFEFGL